MWAPLFDRPRPSLPVDSADARKCQPLEPESVACLCGSSFRLQVVSLADISQLRRLAEKRIRVYACAADAGASIFEADLRGPIAFVIGNEGAGLSDDRILLRRQPPRTVPRSCGIVECRHRRLHCAVRGIAATSLRIPRKQAMSLFDALPGDPAYSNETPSDLRQRPLAERMRPRTLDEFVGQEHLLGPGKALRLQLETDDTTSMILWGPPGVGKTTLAKIIAHTTKATFIEFSAGVSGIKEIKMVMAEADQAASAGMRTILFVDEIHRFNRSQQDAFLPYVERGAIRLIGATTENPSFELNAALLSRCRVYVLEALSDEQIVTLLHRALTDTERGLGGFGITPGRRAAGDCRIFQRRCPPRL